MNSKRVTIYMIYLILEKSKAANPKSSISIMNMEVLCSRHEKPLYNNLSEEEKVHLANDPNFCRSCVWVNVPELHNDKNLFFGESFEALETQMIGYETKPLTQLRNQSSLRCETELDIGKKTSEKFKSCLTPHQKAENIKDRIKKDLQCIPEYIEQHKTKKVKTRIFLQEKQAIFPNINKLNYEITLALSPKFTNKSSINKFGYNNYIKKKKKLPYYVCISFEEYKIIQDSFKKRTGRIFNVQQNSFLYSSYKNLNGVRIIHCCEGFNNINFHKKYILQPKRSEYNDEFEFYDDKTITQQCTHFLQELPDKKSNDQIDHATSSTLWGKDQIYRKKISLLRIIYNFNIGEKIFEELKKMKFSSSIYAFDDFLSKNFEFEIESVGYHSRIIDLQSKANHIGFDSLENTELNTSSTGEFDRQNVKRTVTFPESGISANETDFENVLDAKIINVDVYSNIKVRVETIIYKMNNYDKFAARNSLFLEMPEIKFYLDWKIENKLIFCDETFAKKEIYLIQHVLEHYDTVNMQFDIISARKSITNLRIHIKNYLESISSTYPQISVYRFALELKTHNSDMIQNEKLYAVFLLFIITFKLSKGQISDFFPFDNQNEISYDCFMKMLVSRKTPALVISLLLYDIIEDLKMNTPCASKKCAMSKSILYPFYKKCLIFSKCGLCNNLILTYASNRHFAYFFYAEIEKVLANY